MVNGKKIKPKWYIIGDKLKYDEHFNTKVEIELCPFCQTILPDIEKSKKSF